MTRMSMQAHVKKICETAYFYLRNINSIRKLLSQQDTDKLIHAFVSSRLDCGNALLYGIPKNLLQRLQLVQNAAARTIFMSQKCDHVPPLLGQLHWLPVEQRIMFKICLLTLGNAPFYIQDSIVPYNCNFKGLRSSPENFLTVPPGTTKTYGDRAFAMAAPTGME